MPTCYNCQGTGRETYDEDGRTVTDACYHCGATGQVDEDTDFHDRLSDVAATLAYQQETEYRAWVNADPEGDGYDLGGYENGMMPHDYFRSRVWDRTYEIAEKLSAMPLSDQQLLIAWNELPPEPIKLTRAQAEDIIGTLSILAGESFTIIKDNVIQFPSREEKESFDDEIPF